MINRGRGHLWEGIDRKRVLYGKGLIKEGDINGNRLIEEGVFYGRG